MSKLSLERVTSSFGFQAAFNNILSKIESEFADKVLYRDNPIGEVNNMHNDLDMSGHDVLNVGMISADDFRVNGQDLGETVNSLVDKIDDALIEVRDAVDEAEDWANIAQQAATTVAYYNHEGVLLAGQDTITLPWSYDVNIGVEVYLSGVKQTESTLTFVSPNTVQIGLPVSVNTPFEVVANAGAKSDLSQPSGSDGVGFVQGGTGATSTTVQQQLRFRPRPENYATNMDYVNACKALATNENFTQNGAKIERIPDKLFVGNAIDSDGAFPNVEKDWLSVFQEGTGLSAGTIINAVMAALTVEKASSNVGGLFGSQSLYCTTPNISTIGLMGIAVNNNTAVASRVWGGYFEAHKEFGSTGTGCRGIEIDTRIETGINEIDPFPAQQTTSSCLQLGSGAGVPTTGNSVNTGAAIQIVDNGTSFRKGIVFLKDSIEGTDGDTGSGVAVAMAKNHTIDWYNNSSGRVGRITSNAAAGGGEIRFTDTGPLLLGQNGLSVARFTDAAGAVNSFQIVAAATGVAPQIIASGTDANVDFRLITKGAGVLRFGTWTSNADAAVNGYVTIKDSAGTVRKLATIA